MVQLHSELGIEAEGVERFPPRRGAGEVHVVGLGFSPQFFEFEDIGRGKSDCSTCGVRFGREGSDNGGDNPYRFENRSRFKEN